MEGKPDGDGPANEPAESQVDSTLEIPEQGETAKIPTQTGRDMSSDNSAARTESPRQRRRRARDHVGDEYGPEPAWLQNGTGGRTLIGIATILAIVAAVGGLGWWMFKGSTFNADTDQTAVDGAACQLTKQDEPGGVKMPKDLGKAPKRQTATVSTNFGSVSVLLFGDAAACGVSNFGHLAKEGLYKDNQCHRLTTQQTDPTVTLRCGDPKGSAHGPGYRMQSEDAFTDKTGRDYVALINNKTGQSGSAFAFIRGESKPTASLSVIGQVISGGEVLDKIGAAAGMEAYDDKPPQPVKISGVSIEEGTVTIPPSDSAGSSGAPSGGSGDPSGGSGESGDGSDGGSGDESGGDEDSGSGDGSGGEGGSGGDLPDGLPQP